MSVAPLSAQTVGRSRLFEFWVPLGLILTSAIQLRFIAGAIGFGELILFGSNERLHARIVRQNVARLAATAGEEH